MVTPFVPGHGQGAGINQHGGNPAFIRTRPIQVISMQAADQMQGPKGRNDRGHARWQPETEMMGDEAASLIPAASVMGIDRDHHGGPLCGSGIVQQEGKRPEGARHGDGASRVILAVEQDAAHCLEIQRAEISKAAWRICQADNPGGIFPAPDHRLSGDGNVRIMDKNVTSIGRGTPPTGARDWRWPRPAAEYRDNR